MSTAAKAAPITIDFTRVPVQVDAYRAFQPGNRIANAWGRGTGKSWFAQTMMYLAVAKWDGTIRKTPAGPLRGVRIFYMFPTLKHFKRLGHAQRMLDALSPHGPFGILGARIDRTDWSITFPGGSTIQILTAEVSNRGARADIAVLDEADEIDIATYEAEVNPWFTEPWSLGQVLITGTPKRGRFGLLWRAFHVWPNGDAEHEPVAGHFGFHATVYDADGTTVSRAEADRARRTISPIRFDTEYMCNFDSSEGLVYPFFDPALHVRKPPALGEFHEYIVGLDHGFNDPTAIIVIGVLGSGKDTLLHVVREYYLHEKVASEIVNIAREVERDFPRAHWYADHDLAKNAQIKQDARVRIVEAEKGPGSVESGVAQVADFLFVQECEDGRRLAHLYVDPSCKHTIDEFGKYRRKRDARDIDRVLDTIDSSKDDHCMDAIRYAVFSHFVGPQRRYERELKLRG